MKPPTGQFWRTSAAQAARQGRQNGGPSTVVPVLVLSLALAVAVSAGIPERTIAVRVWLVAVGAVVLRLVVSLVRQAPTTGRHTAFDVAARPVGAPVARKPPGLRQSEWIVTLMSGSAADLHFRVRPVLRDVAGQRLASHHDLDLDAADDGAAAAELCGPTLWELVRPARPVPEDRTAPGLDPRAAPEVLDALERL